MSLTKKPEMTEKKVAANARNRKLAHGPATAEGRERIRAASLRHGFCAQAEEVAMRALGEDPAHYQELLEELWETYQPSDGAQEGLVIHLARCTWLMNRAVRMQEGCALRQAQEVSSGRQDRLHAQMMRLKIMADSLRLLVQSVAHDHYVTTPADLEKMKSLHQDGVLKDMGEIALALFYQLQAPGTDEHGIDPNEQGRRAAARIREIFGLTPDCAPPGYVPPPTSRPQESQPVADAAEVEDERYPNISAAEWEARERPRQLLENILTRQAEICEAQRQALLKESVKGPSPYERAAEIAPTHPNARVMRRMQETNFREIRRVTNLLLRLKRYELQREALERSQEKPRRGSRDVIETKGVGV